MLSDVVDKLVVSAEVGDLFLSLVELGGDLLEESSHAFLPVEHVAGLLVAFDVVLNFLLQVLVNSLVFQNAEQALVDLAVQHLVLVGQLEVLLSQVLSLQGRLVQLALAGPHRGVQGLQLASEVLVLVGGVFEGLAELLVLALALLALSLELGDLFLEFSLLLSELLDLLVGGGHYLFASLEFLKELLVILFGLEEHIF